MWKLSVAHLATKSVKNRLSFNSPLQNNLVLTLTEDFIIQAEPEKQENCQILEKKFHNLSDLN